MNPLLDNAVVQRYLASFPSKSRRRGRHYFEDKAVLEVECLQTDLEYAAVVRGGEDYDVLFEYDPEEGSWSAECSCPMMYDCKHAFAAMLALQANAPKFSVGAPVPVAKPKRGRKAKTQPVKVVLHKEPQPPPSPLMHELRQKLGRDLDKEEAGYVQIIQWLYQQARNGYQFTGETLRRLVPDLRSYDWTPLQLWPDLPATDLEFWLYCAWELRRRNLALPAFLQPVTDFAQIEQAMQAWQRRKDIASWRENLNKSDTSVLSEAEPVDFRLMILPSEARVQWRNLTTEKFKDLKQAHLRRFIEQFGEGELAVTPESTGLWLAVYQPYDSYSACHFAYDRAETRKMLGRVLRLNGVAERIVTPQELPLARVSEPLRYQLDPAKDEEDYYSVRLVQPDGAPAPPILAAMPGRPPLYLTAQAVFEGPPPHGFDKREPLRIPAPALETLQGIRFLQQLKLDLPERIATRTKRIELQVRLICEIKSTYPGSDTEAVYLRVCAEVDGKQTEQCTPWGWNSQNNGSVRQIPEQAANGLIPLVDRSAQDLFPARLETLGAKWDDYHARWRVRLTRNFPDTFLPWLASLPPQVLVQMDKQLATLRDEPVAGSVQLNLEEADVDWFDLRVALKVSDTTLTPEELKLLLNARGGYVRLGKKGWRRLQFDLPQEDDERLARLGLNARDFTAEPQRLHALQLADEAARKFLPEAQVQQVQRRAAEIQTRVTPPVPEGIGAELRPYQVAGFHFLAYLTANHFGGVLADDMGLGKTLQTLTWLWWLRQTPEHRATNGDLTPPAASAGANGNGHGTKVLPALVVCPKSVMDNWRNEAQRFCSGLQVRLWAGEEATELEAARGQADLLVLNYAQLRSLSPAIAQHRWLAVILDEAQYVKNPDSQTAQAARALQAQHRLALTGTPIENRLLDLWSIFSFAMPGVLGNRAHFTRSYSQQEDPFARRRLAARVRPFLLRRAKGQVAKDLPDRVEEDLICEMDGEQKTLYRAEFKRAQQMLLSVKTQQELNEQRFNFLTSLLRLRQICCHPALVSAELRQAESAKLAALLDLLEPLIEEGHKVLVFSQFVSMLEILRETLKERQWAHFYLAGDTENRGELVESFQNAEGAAVFLLSLKAGGFGLNLTAASYVVLFDPWWNPAVEMQAIDRTHRIGQTCKVMAYRLLIKDSIEQKIRQLQRSKAALAEDVLGEEKFSQSLTLDDLRFLFTD